MKKRIELHFTQEQMKEILSSYANQEKGLEDLLKLCFEAIMKQERHLHNEEHRDVSNGFRSRRIIGREKLMELRVPRSRYGNFYPVLLGLLKDQEAECRMMAFELYGAGLTTRQVGEMFEKLYGQHYSAAQVSRLFESAREEVKEWLERPLENYYPIVMIDATFISTRRGDNVSKEAYYTILGVRPDRSREVLAVVNFPTESALGWEEVFSKIKQRGVKKIDLFVCDGLTGIETAIHKHFPMSGIQLCVVHLQRNICYKVRPKERTKVMEEVKQVFCTGQREYTPAQAMEKWKDFTNRWGKLYPSLLRMQKSERIEWYFTYLNYDYRIQHLIYSTNWIERLNRDYKRTLRMRGALPNAEATILLLGYVAMTRKYYLRKIPKLNYEQTKFHWEND